MEDYTARDLMTLAYRAALDELAERQLRCVTRNAVIGVFGVEAVCQDDKMRHVHSWNALGNASGIQDMMAKVDMLRIPQLKAILRDLEKAFAAKREADVQEFAFEMARRFRAASNGGRQ